jgi:hypothetical protein
MLETHEGVLDQDPRCFRKRKADEYMVALLDVCVFISITKAGAAGDILAPSYGVEKEFQSVKAAPRPMIGREHIRNINRPRHAQPF